MASNHDLVRRFLSMDPDKGIPHLKGSTGRIQGTCMTSYSTKIAERMRDDLGGTVTFFSMSPMSVTTSRLIWNLLYSWEKEQMPNVRDVFIPVPFRYDWNPGHQEPIEYMNDMILPMVRDIASGMKGSRSGSSILVRARSAMNAGTILDRFPDRVRKLMRKEDLEFLTKEISEAEKVMRFLGNHERTEQAFLNWIWYQDGYTGVRVCKSKLR